jgi:hypothetical protein
MQEPCSQLSVQKKIASPFPRIEAVAAAKKAAVSPLPGIDHLKLASLRHKDRSA